MTSFKYRPDVDGLRAVAVGLVLLFHAGLGFTGGFVGVDVFFVISGFLITGLILKKQASGDFKLGNFWLRRIRRIIPAAAVMSFATLAAGFLLLLPSDFKALAESSVAHQLMLANVFFLYNTGYFDGNADQMPLLHTWSLAVEEQFYLFLPFLLLLLHRYMKRATLVVLLVIGLISLAYSQYLVLESPEAAYFLLPSRAWELLIGGLVWFVPGPSKVKPWMLEILSALSLIAIIGVGALYTHSTPFPGFGALLPCLATVLFIYCNTNKLTLGGRVLATRPFVFVGLISYSLYLWHWPVMAYTRYWNGNYLSNEMGLLLIVVSFGLAILSWRFVETPFRVGWQEARPIKVIGVAIASTAVIICTSVTVSLMQGVPQRLPKDVRQAAAEVVLPEIHDVTLDEIREGDLPRLGVGVQGDKPPAFILWGDSHAHALQDCFDLSANEHGVAGVTVTRAGTLPLLGVTRPQRASHREIMPLHNQAVMRYIQEKKVPNIFLVGRWALYVEGREEGPNDTLLAEVGVSKTDRSIAAAAFEAGFERTLDGLMESGARIWVIKQVPLQDSGIYPQRTLVLNLLLGKDIPSGVSLEAHEKRQALVNEIIDRVAASRDNVTVIDPAEIMFDRLGDSLLADLNGAYYRDKNHLSPYGAETIVKPFIDEIMLKMKDEE